MKPWSIVGWSDCRLGRRFYTSGSTARKVESVREEVSWR